MLRSTKPSFLKRALTVLAVGAAAIGSIFYIQEFSKIDPLLNMRKRSVVTPDQFGVKLSDVHLVQYQGSRKVAEADVKDVFIPSDRSEYRLTHVQQGAYIPENKKTVYFSAPKAIWNSISRTLMSDKSARIWSKDFDLKTPVFRINEKEQTLYAPSKIEGRFFGGKVKSNNLLYKMKEQLATIGPTNWNGNLALSLQDDANPQKKQWEFESASGTISIENGIRTWTKGTATDGEIIIQAEKIEHEEKSDIVTATGNVRYFSAKANLSCEKAVIYRREKRAVLTGAVDMLIKPKDRQQKAVIEEIPPFRPFVPTEVSKERPTAPPRQGGNRFDEDAQNPKTLRDYPMVITASRIEYWYGRGSRRATATGTPQARQELPEGRWRKVWANTALYDGERDQLTMQSRSGQKDVRLQVSTGDDIIASRVVVSTREDDEKLRAEGAKGKVYGASDEDTTAPDPVQPGKGGNLQGPIGSGKKKVNRRS